MIKPTGQELKLAWQNINHEGIEFVEEIMEDPEDYGYSWTRIFRRNDDTYWAIYGRHQSDYDELGENPEFMDPYRVVPEIIEKTVYVPYAPKK